MKDVQFDKVKGTLLDLNQFYTVMPEFEGVDEWQVILRQGESMMDELIINVSPVKSKKFSEQGFTTKLNQYIKEKMEISPNMINVMTPDAISRSLGMETQLKEKRILDLRPKD
jgi:hypothetical protein